MMGQMPRKPLMGEVEVGLEALVLLESREEERSRVLQVLSSPPSPHQRRASRAHRHRRIHRNPSIRKEKEDDTACGSQRVSATSLPQLHMDTEEQQLADVYYSAFYLHPPREVLVQEGAMAKGAEGGDEEGTGSIVTREQLRIELKDIFDVDDETMRVIEQKVLTREPPHTTLHITVHGAKDLKPKSSKETSHPYCIVRVIGSTETEIYRTPVLLSTLSPAWEAEFECSIPCLRDAKLLVEIWHEPQEVGMEQLKGMKDIRRELGRLVRDATANLQTKETRNLLGTVTVPLPDVNEQSVEGWYSLVKGKEEGMSQPGTRESFRDGKKRGSVRLSLRLSTSAELNLNGPHWYNGFLNKVVQYHLQYMNSFSHRTRGGSTRKSDRSTYSYRSSIHSTRSNGIYCSTRRPHRNCSDSPNSSGSSFENEKTWKLPTMWSGIVSGASSSLLDYYSTILGLSPAAATLAWWNIASKIPSVDQAFLGELLKRLQNYISEDKFSQQDIEEISSSLKLWTANEFYRLRNLTDCYPAASSRIVSHAQIKSLLVNFHVLQANPHTQCLKIFPKDATISELVSEALMDFVKNWWESTLKSRGRNSPLAHEDQQLGIVVSVAGDVCSFLTDVSNFYHDVFLREAKISYLRLTYILLTSELAARIRPLLHKLYDSPASRQTNSYSARHGEVDKHSLEAGTPVWQLYKKFELIQRIGENLPMEVQLQSGIYGYHQWFLGAVTRWQERLMARTRDLMAREVEKDTFEMNSSHISSSADGTKSNFTIVINSWEKLAWPDDENIVGKKLVKELCGLGTLYTKIVLNKIEAWSRGDNSTSTSFLSPQSCIALNNIEFLRHEVHILPELFDLPQENDDDQFSIIPKTLSKMEGSILRFMDSAIRKVKPTLHSAVVRSCETGSEVQLLQDVLDQDLSVLRHQLNKANLQRLLLKIWNVLIVIFCSIVDNNSNKRNAEYFKNVYRVLERSWYFFTPTDRQGLDPQHAHTEEYQSLQKILCNLKMPTESLIAKYYKERHEELQHACNTYLAELVVRVYFLATGKLIVEVIMARNIGRSSVKSPDTFVQVKLVPSDWFPNVQSQKTKIQKKCDSPVYDEKFELPISETGVKNGYLLFLLKTSRHLFQSSEVFAEAVLPLEDLPSIDTPTARSVKNKVLYMNIPKKGEDYTAVKALKFRTWDTRAQNFLQKFSDRT